jgi:hypothetical protein
MSLNKEIHEIKWLIAKNIFGNEEIHKFRELALKETDYQGDLLSRVFLSDVITGKRLSDIIKDYLGIDSLFFIGDSSVAINAANNRFDKESRDCVNVNSSVFKNIDYSVASRSLFATSYGALPRLISKR